MGQLPLTLQIPNLFELIITDIDMPNMNGIELIHALRALPNFKFTPILCLTTESSGDMKQKGKEAGSNRLDS